MTSGRVRFLGALTLILGVLTVAAPPAQAAVTLTARAAPAVVKAGQPSAVVGRASGSAYGSRVYLQRRDAGVWRSISSRIVRTPRTFTFPVTARRGVQYYRVLMPRHLGNPRTVSRAVTVTGQWRPTVTLDATPEHYVLLPAPAHHQRIRWSGWTTAGSVADLQILSDGVWSSLAGSAVLGGGFEGTIGNLSRGTLLRAAVRSNGADRLIAYSPVAASGLIPYELGAGTAVQVNEIASGVGAVVHLTATAGDQVQLGSSQFDDGDLGSYTWTVAGPTGANVPTEVVAGGRRIRFVAPVTGTYSFLVGAVNSPTLDLTVDRTLRGTLTVDGPAVSLAGAPGQDGLLTFTGTAGEVITVDTDSQGFAFQDSCTPPRFAVSGPTGDLAALVPGAWELPTTGTYRLRVGSCGPTGVIDAAIRVLRAAVVEPSVDGAASTIDLARGRAAVVEVTAAAGNRITAAVGSTGFDGTGSTFDGLRAHLLLPDGTSSTSGIGFRAQATAAGLTGRYRQVLRSPSNAPGTITVQATAPIATSASPDTPVGFDTAGRAGQEIALTFDAVAGGVYDLQARDGTGTVQRPDWYVESGSAFLRLYTAGPFGFEYAEQTGPVTYFVTPEDTTGTLTVETPTSGPALTFDGPDQPLAVSGDRMIASALTFPAAPAPDARYRLAIDPPDSMPAGTSFALTILSPTGDRYFTDEIVNNEPFHFDLARPAAGEYRVLVQPEPGVTGDLLVRATSLE